MRALDERIHYQSKYSAFFRFLQMFRFVLLFVCLAVTEGRNIQRVIRGKWEIYVVLSLGSQNSFDATPLTCSERVSLESTIPTKLMITRKFETNAKNNTCRDWQLESAERLPKESMVKVVCKLLKSRQIQANIKSS